MFQSEKLLGVCKSNQGKFPCPPTGGVGLYWYRKPTGLSPFLQVATTHQEQAQRRGWDLEGFGPMSSLSLERRWWSRGVVASHVSGEWTGLWLLILPVKELGGHQMRLVGTSWRMKLWVVCQELLLQHASVAKHFHSFQKSSCRLRVGICIFVLRPVASNLLGW